jgi:hypothetical protein
MFFHISQLLIYSYFKCIHMPVGHTLKMHGTTPVLDTHLFHLLHGTHDYSNVHAHTTVVVTIIVRNI